VHAAFHGTSWDGDAIACVVAGAAAAGGPGPAGRGGRLTFFFRTESAEVISHVQGCESDLLGQLTGGLVVPLDASEGAEAAGGDGGEVAEERAGGVGGYGGFLRGISLAAAAAAEAPAVGGEGEEAAEAEGAAAAAPDRFALEREALAQWRRLRALRAPGGRGGQSPDSM